MRSWPALLIAPTLALADQSATLALATWSCVTQRLVLPHVVHATFLVAAIVLTLMATYRWRTGRPSVPEDASDAGARDHFFAISGTMVGTLSALVIAAMWLAQWMLSPCYT
jgi:hypothetical protein